MKVKKQAEKPSMEEDKFDNDSVCKTFRSKMDRLFAWGPIIALSILFYNCFISMMVISKAFHPLKNALSFIHFLFTCVEIHTIFNKFTAALFIGPGFVPLKWSPKSKKDIEFLQYCEICEGYKPPRSHHCRHCGRCVYKMDHHCPWINTCCGHLNHGYFMHFTYVIVIGAFHCAATLSFLLGLQLYVVYYRLVRYYSAYIIFNWYESMLVFFALGTSWGVVVAVGILSLIQTRYIAKNQTSIESWIIRKSKHRKRNPDEQPFVFPYDLGPTENMRQVITFSGETLGDGIEWPLKEGCHKYDITREQILISREKPVEQKIQKLCKAHASRPTIVVSDYTGYFFALCSLNCWSFLNSPCPTEDRMVLHLGDVVQVTRMTKYWLYGELKKSPYLGRDLKKPHPKGWFPKACVADIVPAKASGSFNELLALAKSYAQESKRKLE